MTLKSHTTPPETHLFLGAERFSIYQGSPSGPAGSTSSGAGGYYLLDAVAAEAVTCKHNQPVDWLTYNIFAAFSSAFTAPSPASFSAHCGHRTVRLGPPTVGAGAVLGTGATTTTVISAVDAVAFTPIWIAGPTGVTAYHDRQTVFVAGRTAGDTAAGRMTTDLIFLGLALVKAT